MAERKSTGDSKKAADEAKAKPDEAKTKADEPKAKADEAKAKPDDAKAKPKPNLNVEERMEGVQGWMAELEKKQERTTRVGGIAMGLAVLAAASALVLGILNKQDAATTEDVDELTEKVNALGASVEQQTEKQLNAHQPAPGHGRAADHEHQRAPAQGRGRHRHAQEEPWPTPPPTPRRRSGGRAALRQPEPSKP